MASTIKLKSSTTSSNAPSTLAQGEFAINVADGNLFYGDGSSVKQNFVFDDLTVKGNLTAQQYIVSSSVTYTTQSFSSGSTAFGDSADDTHVFTGNITASNNISASGDVIAGNITANQVLRTTKTGSVTDPALLIGANSGFLAGNNAGIILDPLVPGTTFYVPYFVCNGQKIFGFGTIMSMEAGIDMQSNRIYFDGDQTNTYIASNADDPEDLEIHADQDILLSSDRYLIISGSRSGSAFVGIQLTGNITASGDISSSGDIRGSEFYVNGKSLANTSGNTIRLGWSQDMPIEIGKDSNPIKLVGQVTASIISASDSITGDLTGTATNATNVNVGNSDGSSTYYILGALGTGNQALKRDSGVTYNAGTSTLDIGGKIDLGANGIELRGDANNLIVYNGGLQAEGAITASGTISSSGDLIANEIKPTKIELEKSSTTDGNANGDVVYFGGTTSMLAGRIYHYKSDGTWELANPNATATSDGLLGVALGASSDTNGVLLRGMVTLNHDPGAVGDVLYLDEQLVSSKYGAATSTAPAGSGDVVRIIGYCLDATNGQIYFNPSPDFIVHS